MSSISVHCSTTDTYGAKKDWLPVTEDHPLRPMSGYARGKADAEDALLAAHYAEGFPVTIIRPATTYGPKLGLLRQISWDFSWIDRVRKGKPIIVCGDGNTIHQFLHADDAALCFANVLGRPHCIGQIYNMVDRHFATWADYHRLAMKVIGREVDLVGVPLQDLVAIGVPGSVLVEDFAHHSYFSAEKLLGMFRSSAPACRLRPACARFCKSWTSRAGCLTPTRSTGKIVS